MPHLPPITVSSKGKISVDFPVGGGTEHGIVKKDDKTSSIDIDQEGARVYRIDIEQPDGSVVVIVPKSGMCTVKVYIAQWKELIPETAAKVLALGENWESAEPTAQ